MKANEVLLKCDGRWLHFAEPQCIISVHHINDVVPALHEIERLIEEHNWHAAGFIGYEAAGAFDPAFPTRAPEDFPLLWFGLYAPPQVVDAPEPRSPKEASCWKPGTDRDAYDAAIDQIKTHLRDGRTYQVNYTIRLCDTHFTNDAWEFFLHLAKNQQTHAAYIDTGRYVICSASPELFFQLDGDSIICRPMKGTTPRGRTTREDGEKSRWLQSSEKNKAENLMITDMVRNDLGRIAETGSVQVPELFTIERYPTLWHMTSTVTAKTTASMAEIMGALFPSASITGAPKVSTMEIIDDLETTPRRIYTGSIGTIGPGRTAKFSVAIRTALIDRQNQHAEYGVGGGIVWDSTSTDEYSELLLKSRVLTDDAPAFSLLETILWTEEEGYFLRRLHTGRLIDSAEYFGFPLTIVKIEEALDSLARGFHSPQRVRLLVDNKGSVIAESQPYVHENKILHARLSHQPVASHDAFLFHKTTHRSVYEEARKNRPLCDDVLLFNERGEATEFTTGNLVVQMGGVCYTPPQASGLLAGTFRAHLLERGEIHERVILIDEVKSADRLFFINSIRKTLGVILDA